LGIVRAVLVDLESYISTYDKLDTKTQRKWEALRWGMKDVNKIKLRLINVTTTLNSVLSCVTKYVELPPVSLLNGKVTWERIPLPTAAYDDSY
jgi:hypothetical protein